MGVLTCLIPNVLTRGRLGEGLYGKVRQSGHFDAASYSYFFVAEVRSSEGGRACAHAVLNKAGSEIDSAMPIKLYRADPSAERRSSRPSALGGSPGGSRAPRPSVRLRLLRGAPESHDSDGDAAVHPADQRLLQEGRRP